MDAQLGLWRDLADTLWSALVFSHGEAARLLGDIVNRGGPGELAGAARQALPSLKQAATAKADPDRRSVARRRFGRVREELHALTDRPAFGRRALAQVPLACAAGDCMTERRLLGLPLGGRISGPEIAAAYKRAAKAAHPDHGGDAAAFTAIVRARDVLLGRG